MLKQFFFLILLFSFSMLMAQSSFKKLSRPEKCWVLFHPVKAKKALKIAREVLLVVDSIKQNGLIGVDNTGGNLDAFKHTYWMASLTLKIGRKQTLSLGKAHEKGNYLQYKKHALEDAILPDSISSVMDLRNNAFGVSLVNKNEIISKADVQKKVLDALADGKLTIIKKDEKGNFLTCDGAVISINEWKGKWNIPKCTIASFSH